MKTEQRPIRNLNDIHEARASTGDRLADRVAAIGGSWGFIIAFGVILVVWTVGNSMLLGRHAFDAYPYIFLNLVLSMLAAIQAPIIMMSQNRAAARDRAAAALDYDVNCKAEQEILAIHSRMDREIIGLHRKMDVLLRQAGIDPAPLDIGMGQFDRRKVGGDVPSPPNPPSNI